MSTGGMCDWLLRILAFAALLIFTACHRFPQLSDYSTIGTQLSVSDSNTVFNQLAAQNEKIQTMRLLTRCQFDYDGARYGYRYAFVAERNKGLRIEQLPVSGFYSISTLVSDRERTAVIHASERKAFLFEPGEDGLSSLLGVSLPFVESEVATILAGAVPERFIDRGASVSVFRDQEQLWLHSSRAIVELREDLRVSKAHYFEKDSGKEQVAIQFVYDQEMLPLKFVLFFPQYDARLECDAQKRGVNEPIKAQVFDVQIPVGYEVSGGEGIR